MTSRLFIALEDVCPDDLEVLPAPFDVALADATVTIPDLIVARRSDLTPRDCRPPRACGGGAVAEHATPSICCSSRHGWPPPAPRSYWVVYPPSLTAFELRDGVYVEIASVVGDAEFTAAVPYPVVVRPADLVSEHRRR